MEKSGSFYGKEERLTTEKKFNLIDWDTVCSPKQCGGARVRDPLIMKLSHGAKFLWRLISGENAWWKKSLQKKYMPCTRIKCVENINTSRDGSPIWDLCKKAAYIIQDNIHWTTGNGKRINIWHD